MEKVLKMRLDGVLGRHLDVKVNPDRKAMIADVVARREAMVAACGCLAMWTPAESTGRSPLLFAGAGITAGIACQTYYAAWLLPVILVAWSAARWLSDRGEGSVALRGLVVTAALFAVTTAPLLVHYATRPDTATSRTEQVFSCFRPS